jgi:hypothetical protein
MATRCRGLFSPPEWFSRELRAICPDMEAKYLDKSKRWGIFCNGELNRLVEDPVTKEPRPLDQRILRKIRVDVFLTNNSRALDTYLDNDNRAMRAYTARGIVGVTDYLTRG